MNLRRNDTAISGWALMSSGWKGPSKRFDTMCQTTAANGIGLRLTPITTTQIKEVSGNVQISPRAYSYDQIQLLPDRRCWLVGAVDAKNIPGRI